MGKVNLIFEPYQWWKVKNGFRKMEIKHTGTTLKVGDTLHLHRSAAQNNRTYINNVIAKRSRKPQDSHIDVKLRHVIHMSIVSSAPGVVMMKLNETPIPRDQANRLAKRCGYRSWYHLYSTMQSYYGLPFHGQILVW